MGAPAGQGREVPGAALVGSGARQALWLGNRDVPEHPAAGTHQLEPGPRGPSFRVAGLRGPAVRRELVHGAPLPKEAQTERSKRGPGQVTDNPILSALQEPQIRTAALSEGGSGNRAPSCLAHPPSSSGQEPLATLRLSASWGGPQGAAGAGRMRAGSPEELGLCSFLL